MKLSTILIVAVPPCAVLATIAIFNPSVLTWPITALLSIVFGVSSAVVQNIVEPF